MRDFKGKFLAVSVGSVTDTRLSMQQQKSGDQVDTVVVPCSDYETFIFPFVTKVELGKKQ